MIFYLNNHAKVIDFLVNISSVTKGRKPPYQKYFRRKTLRMTPVELGDYWWQHRETVNRNFALLLADEGERKMCCHSKVDS